MNLIGNAVKFTEQGEVRLTVRCTRDGQNALMQFDVTDTGLGMTPEQSKRLFQAFMQADTSMTRRFGGTGLGLAISKRLAQMLGGDVELIDSQLGQGSRFRLSIHCRITEAPKQDATVSETAGKIAAAGTSRRSFLRWPDIAFFSPRMGRTISA